MYHPAEAAEKLNIAASTLRKYSRHFADQLSPAAQRKRRRYSESDLVILSRICTLRAEGVPFEEISAHLAGADLPPATSDLPPALNTLAPEVMEGIAANRDQINALQRDLRSLAELAASAPAASENGAGISMEQISDLREEIALLRSEMDQLGERVDQAVEEIEQLKARPQAMSAGAESTMASQTISDIKTELMQLKSELFRTRERQKALEDRLEQDGSQSSGLFRRR
jgi:DNA-binding transcriptional MerR regulator